MSYSEDKVIQNYKISKLISEGSYCDSYFALDHDNKEFFLKEYKDPQVSSNDFQSFYQNQDIMISKLNEMGSVTETIIEHFVFKELYYQVKVKLKGINLFDWFNDEPSLDDIYQLGIVLCGVIKNLHLNNIVHQDLKPEQIMMVDDKSGKASKLGYRVVLSDFDWSIPDGKMIQLTGTPRYMSPEHYKGDTPNEKSDIYTLGLILFEILTEKSPFAFDDVDGVSKEALADRTLNEKFCGTVKEQNPQIPDSLSNIIMQCLKVDSKKRPDIDEIQSELITASKNNSSNTTTTASPSPIKPTASAAPSPIKPSDPKPTAPVSPKIPDPVKTPSPSPTINELIIEANGESYLIFNKHELDRSIFKKFFSSVIADDKGNPAYRYMETDKPMLIIEKDEKGFSIHCLQNTKNHFLLNNQKIEISKIPIKNGDILELFSVANGKSIATFNIK